MQDRPRFRTYVVEQRVPSYRYESEFRVGAVLPETGVTYYEVPAEYGVTGYRYTYVNDRAVIVDPRTRPSFRSSNNFSTTTTEGIHMMKLITLPPSRPLP